MLLGNPPRPYLKKHRVTFDKIPEWANLLLAKFELGGIIIRGLYLEDDSKERLLQARGEGKPYVKNNRS